MTAGSVEYNVVINGILPGNKPGEVAESVAPILGLLPSDALHLFNGVAHTVLQRVDLSAAASFQAQLKGLGIDASVAVFEDRSPKPAQKEEQPAAETAEPAPQPPAAAEEAPAPLEEPPAAAEDAPARVEEAPVAAEEAPAPVEEAPVAAEEAAAPVEADPEPEPVAAEEAAPESAMDTRPETDDEFNLDISLPDDAPTAPEPESEDIFDAFEKQAAEQKELQEQEASQAEAAEPAPEPVSEPTEAESFDLDELFDAGEDDSMEDPAPQAPEVPELTMVEEPDEAPAEPAAAAVVTEKVTAVATGVDAARSLDASPITNAAPGSNMLCPSCNTLQPRADQCPGCGAAVARPSEQATERKATAKPKLGPQLPKAAIGAAAGAAVVGAGLWLGLAYTLDFDTAMFAMVTGVLVGLACGLAGGRGAKAAGTSAALALVAIVGATLMLPTPATTELPAPPQPDPAEVWSDEQAPQWYKEAFRDAEYFMTTDGSAAVVRQFMIDSRYTRATRPEEIPESDLRYFYDVDAKDLTWIVQTQPDFETWSARMRGHLSGRQRVALNVSAPPVKPLPTGPTPMQLVYMLLGLACAFGLAQIGLRRSA